MKKSLRTRSSNELLEILVDKVLAESLVHPIKSGEKAVNVVDRFNLFVQEGGLEEVLELLWNEIQ